jgi:hypothetical protein
MTSTYLSVTFGLSNRRHRWEEIEKARRDTSLKPLVSIREVKQRYLPKARACPQCYEPPETLIWVYYKTPPPPEWMLRACGRAGWVTVCEECKRQVDFFTEVFFD